MQITENAEKSVNRFKWDLHEKKTRSTEIVNVIIWHNDQKKLGVKNQNRM